MSFNQQEPDINYELQQLKATLMKFKGAFSSLFLVLLVIIVGWTSYYTVQPDEEAVLIRFGRYIKTTQPGLHFKLPFGIEKVIKVKTKIVHQEEFGFRTSNTSARRTAYSSGNFENESLMLTGDLNVVKYSGLFNIKSLIHLNIYFKLVNLSEIFAMFRNQLSDEL